ncbi:uncharacterized protein LOC144867752 [Branchiostoma floridae x Branchiostoma japonicum]
MASVLLVHDEYGTSRGGISTINRQVALFLVQLGLKVYCTVLTATDKDREDAEKENVILLFPQCDIHEKPSPLWLCDHQSRYPDLPSESDIGFVIGHVLVTSRAAIRIKEGRFPLAKLYLFTHILPEDTEHYKGEGRALVIGGKMKMILEDADKADALFSVGPTIYDNYKNQYRCLQDPSKPHFVFLPKPSDIFIETRLTYVETKTKVVLSVGRVSGVEKLKGYDLAANSFSDVVKVLPKAKWQVRGISRDDFQTSKEIINAGIHSGTFHFTPLEYGTQDDICRDMKQAHLVLMPSRAEPFGLVGLEAIAAGVPVLVSDQSGLADFMLRMAPEFDRSIFKLEGNDAEDSKNLAKKIITMLQNGRREFELAKHLKDKLLKSRYWEESHEQLGQVCGIDEFKAACRPQGPAEMVEMPTKIQHHTACKVTVKEERRDQVSSSKTDERANTFKSSVSTYCKSTLNTLKPLPWDPRFTLDLDEVFTSLVLVGPHGHSPSSWVPPDIPPPSLNSLNRGMYMPVTQSLDDRMHMLESHNGRMLESLDGVFYHKTKNDQAGRFNVLVVGDAGSGKSTLLSKTALDWSCEKGRLAEMNKIVLLVRLREVQPGESIAEIIWDQCVTQSEDISVASIETCLRENEPDLVFLLDGYDELVPSASQSKETIPKLLGQKLYPRSTVIVTSRPYSCVEDYMNVHCQVRVKGFSLNNVEKYVETYFITVGEPRLAPSLLKALQANIVARSMIQTPMFLMLICVLWEDDPTRVFPGTMSGLYQELLICIIRKFCVREGLMPNDEVPSVVSAALLHLGNLSLESLLRGESLVDLGKATKQQTDILLKVGIVSKEVSASRLHPREQLNFPHKTMQEFLAGRYVADTVNTSSGDLHKLVPLDTVDALLKQSNLVQFICSCGGKAIREMLAEVNKQNEFVAAENKKKELNECLVQKVRFGHPLSFHLSGVLHRTQPSQGYRSQLSKEAIAIQHLCMMILYEGQDPRHFPIVSTLLSSLDLAINVPSRDGAALKYYLHNAPELSGGRSLKLTVKEASKGDAVEYLSGLVDLHRNNIGDAKMEPFSVLQYSVASLKELTLSYNKVGDVCMESLSSVLYHLSCLECLDLSHNHIGDEGKEPFAAIQHPVAKLKKLFLDHNDIGDVCMESLSNVLHHLPCLEELDLSKNCIGDELRRPFTAIQHPVARLKKLNLCCNRIGDVCLGSLIGVLHHMSNLEELHLFHNCIGIKGFQSYQDEQSISHHDLGDEWMKPFAAIQQPAILKILSLSRNTMGDVCMRSLTAVLHHLSCLQELHLSNNNINDTELTSFAAKLHHVPNLKVLNLYWNPITEVGIKDFAHTIPIMPVLMDLYLCPCQPVYLCDTAAMSITTTLLMALTKLPVLECLGLENIQVERFMDMSDAADKHRLYCLLYTRNLVRNPPFYLGDEEDGYEHEIGKI